MTPSIANSTVLESTTVSKRALGPPLLIDAHVHMHSSFDASVAIDAAAGHFEIAKRQFELPETVSGCLLLTECMNDNWFRQLQHRRRIGRWRICLTDEESSVVLTCPGCMRIVVVAGRQIVTVDGVEVLGVGMVDPISDGQTVNEVVRRVIHANALAVVPWGFGKWLGRRGRLVQQVAMEYGRNLLLGDNGGRAAWSPRPRLLRRLERLSCVTLPGSDPLPFSKEQSRVGSYGCIVDAHLNCERPAAGIVSALSSLRSSPAAYGRRVGLTRFAGLQSAMQWRNRVKGGKA